MDTTFKLFTYALAMVGIWQLKTWGIRIVDRWHEKKIRALDEINDMHVADQALAQGPSASKPTRIVMEGGLIQEVLNMPPGLILEVFDYDTDIDADHPNVQKDEQGDDVFINYWKGGNLYSKSQGNMPALAEPPSQPSIQLIATNAQRADLIDALLVAIEGTNMKIQTTFSENCILDGGALLEEEDKRLFDEWVAQKKRFTSLREYFLREESTAIANHLDPKERPHHDPTAN